ncbi:unnamed protein product [Angiostrongylus costaricensis]|uniref:Neur_chan_LBD domain-containing protein n=1 Tax=Angiostrongylus costaricensis TaxID=334426 RepID=A0A158PEV6_ANGCS|nr:unnamed protein product [Angiostrongylus costaricensis]
MRGFGFVVVVAIYVVESNRYAEQLYEDLLYYYNKNVRPVKNASESIKVKFGASLIRIIDVDEVNQVLTTNLWLEMQWFDYKLSWDPTRWGGIKKLHIPSDQIWIPDILLYNNADGEPHITIMSDALVYHNGLIVWKPPSIYKSFCPINIEYFPYDSQSCSLKFGGWSYNGFLLDVRQLPRLCRKVAIRSYILFTTSFRSLEWDLMSLTSQRHEQLYPGCCGQDFYIDVTFDIALRRKTLFYTVNLVIPCMLIAILTTFVFYIPPIEHKMTFSISILVSLTVFYLVLIELIPPTSLVIPLIGRYLLFTMFLVAMSILLSVLSLNYYRRDGSAHPMPHWMQAVFIETFPKYIGIKKAEEDEVSDRGSSTSAVPPSIEDGQKLSQLAHLRGMHPDLIRRMIDNVSFIADHFKAMKKEDKISSDWSYVANVIDRLVLIVFTFVNVVGTVLIIQNSPMLFDQTEPMKIVSSSLGTSLEHVAFFCKHFFLLKLQYQTRRFYHFLA